MDCDDHRILGGLFLLFATLLMGTRVLASGKEEVATQVRGMGLPQIVGFFACNL